MSGKKLLLLICSSFFFWSACLGTAQARNPAQDLMNLYERELEDKNMIVPYTVGILALNELEHKRHYAQVRQFIVWYFSKLNYPDKHGVTGSVYDYVLKDGKECSTEEYDSVDGYSGLFLHLLHRYAVETGDIEIIKNNWGKIEDIAYTLPYLQDSDGLTRALPDSQVKYLMDNCETYGGVSAYIALRKLIGKEKSQYYYEVQQSVKEGIFSQLYDQENAIFAWAIENKVKSPSSWEQYYPDGYAQILLVYYDILLDKPELRTQIWNAFMIRHGAEAEKSPIEQRIMYKLTRKKMKD